MRRQFRRHLASEDRRLGSVAADQHRTNALVRRLSALPFAALAEAGTIHAVSAQTQSELDSLGDTRRFRHRCRSGATVGTGADFDVADDNYNEEFFEVDPNTSAAWTEANLDSAEFGVEVRD